MWVRLLLPKNSHACRYNGRKPARLPCRAQSAANRRVCWSIPARLSPSCTKVSLNRSDSPPCRLATEPTRISARLGRGASKRISAAKLDDFNIGVFKMPSEKFGVAPLPHFALQQGSSRIAGILGMDTLYTCHAIIDLDGMRLFLK